MPQIMVQGEGKREKKIIAKQAHVAFAIEIHQRPYHNQNIRIHKTVA
jgi:hypothetical protein